MKSILLAFLCTIIPIHAAETGTWKSLFDGKTLKGWEQHGGKATYAVGDDLRTPDLVPLVEEVMALRGCSAGSRLVWDVDIAARRNLYARVCGVV